MAKLIGKIKFQVRLRSVGSEAEDLAFWNKQLTKNGWHGYFFSGADLRECIRLNPFLIS